MAKPNLNNGPKVLYVDPNTNSATTNKSYNHDPEKKLKIKDWTTNHRGTFAAKNEAALKPVDGTLVAKSEERREKSRQTKRHRTKNEGLEKNLTDKDLKRAEAK